MSKIAIISQPDQGILVDISGCVDIEEAREHLVSSLEVSSQLPPGTKVDLKLGAILLNEEDVDQVVGLAQQSGITFNQVFATNNQTKEALQSRKLNVAKRVAASLSALIADAAVMEAAAQAEEAKATEQTPATTEKTAAEPGYAGPGCEETSTTTAKAEATQIPQVLYLKQNLRSGQSVSHKGHLVIFGDVNPGAEVVAEGDITVWGALRGMAHAGSNGNEQAEIRALRLQPIQLRIAHSIARSPDKPKSGALVPETARVVNGQIRIQANIPE
ncbi:MAG: septum site-determining protein MinC [Candidatus Obscuribacterales bacterium]|nr:septum site-determining protein MinC [Candidatus Obscuribacterales bacterium]